MAHSSFTSEQDFAAAYEQYADDIFRHCYLRVFSRDKAKVLMTEAYTRLWQFIAEGNCVDSMRLFLYRMSHQIITREKAAGVVETAVPRLQPQDQDYAELSLLQQVSPEDRPVLILHYVDGFSLQDISSILDGAVQDHALALRKGTSLLSSLLQ